MVPDRGDLATTLTEMATADLALRGELAASGELFEGYHPRMEALHQANAARLGALVDVHGWPTVPLVGPEASEAAWLILQHAIGCPDLQRHGLRWLADAVARGEAPARQLAMLEDRVRRLEGRPQLYGTQFDWDAHGELSPEPIEDAADVDQRRAEVGLEPLADAVERLRARAALEGEKPPADPEARRAAYEAWLCRAGWR